MSAILRKKNPIVTIISDFVEKRQFYYFVRFENGKVLNKSGVQLFQIGKIYWKSAMVFLKKNKKSVKLV